MMPLAVSFTGLKKENPPESSDQVPDHPIVFLRVGQSRIYATGERTDVVTERTIDAEDRYREAAKTSVYSVIVWPRVRRTTDLRTIMNTFVVDFIFSYHPSFTRAFDS
jgi:hypothetical protein